MEQKMNANNQQQRSVQTETKRKKRFSNICGGPNETEKQRLFRINEDRKKVKRRFCNKLEGFAFTILGLGIIVLVITFIMAISTMNNCSLDDNSFNYPLFFMGLAAFFCGIFTYYLCFAFSHISDSLNILSYQRQKEEINKMEEDK